MIDNLIQRAMIARQRYRLRLATARLRVEIAKARFRRWVRR